MRHVLRARIEAVKALASFFDQLEQSSKSKSKQVYASDHLALRYGKFVGPPTATTTTRPAIASLPSSDSISEGDFYTLPPPNGRRDAREVIEFLRKRGAKIPMLSRSWQESEWAAALSSDGEGGGEGTSDGGKVESPPSTTIGDDDDVVWVARGAGDSDST